MIDGAVHRDPLRAADLAFRTMGFDRPVEASTLRQLSAAWAAYLSAYERLVRDNSGAADLDLVVALRQDVLRLVDDEAAGEPNRPNEVVRWPQRRPHDEAYLTVPDDPDWIAARLSAYPGWLPINRRRPNVPPGYHLLRVDVARRRAIDVPPSIP